MKIHSQPDILPRRGQSHSDDTSRERGKRERARALHEKHNKSKTAMSGGPGDRKDKYLILQSKAGTITHTRGKKRASARPAKEKKRK